MIEFQPNRFVEKFSHAIQVGMENYSKSGICGFELEWNLMDSHFNPLLMVGTGPKQLSFIDYFRNEIIPPFVKDRTQLEVFHWMVEWATKPYYQLRGAIYESRVAEAILMDALFKAGTHFGERLYYWHGNLLSHVNVNQNSIPGSWHIAKRRYLERCVELFGSALATAGIHTNLSIPEPLLEWDFVHLPYQELGSGNFKPVHLDDYKNMVYIRGTRLMRAFASLFIATSASTPLQAIEKDGKSVVIITDHDSVRNLTFPNPAAIDLPNLYRTYDDYLQVSYDLIRRGVRFGNNNWTPVRARSFAEPVERLIAITSEQLQEIYSLGLYTEENSVKIDEKAKQIEFQNLLARINLPMARVEIRTDDGGHPFEIDLANLTLKYLILLRVYADKDFAHNFRYDEEDIARARQNELLAARWGLKSEIENPISGKPIGMREFLKWTLGEVKQLAIALNMWDDLAPLQAMADGAGNTAEKMRSYIRSLIGSESDEVPNELLSELAISREQQVAKDIDLIVSSLDEEGAENRKLLDLLQNARDEYYESPEVPVTFVTQRVSKVEFSYQDKTHEIVDLAQKLIQFPSVTACSNERIGEVKKLAHYINDFGHYRGLNIRFFNKSKYPALLIGFPEQLFAPVMFSGHFDVVEPEPDDSQFIPRVDGDYLWGRGSADMKTVLATYLVWFKDRLQRGTPYPPVNLLLVGNEENGEFEAMGTPHILKLLLDEQSYQPEILIAGERTGERGDELLGEICTKNRGVIRFEIIAQGEKFHSGLNLSGIKQKSTSLLDHLLDAKSEITNIAGLYLTLTSPQGWQSQISFPYLNVGDAGIYNVTPSSGVLGVEIRPIPENETSKLINHIEEYCVQKNLVLKLYVHEDGVECDRANNYLQKLALAFKQVSGLEPKVGAKLAGTSARFAPDGQGVVWGQSGIGPHAKDERHFIPSILPYYNVLDRYVEIINLPD